MIGRVFNNFELKGAPTLAQKSTKRRTIFFLPKSATFLVKGAQFLTPRKNFMHRFCWRGEILHFFPTFYRFFTKFSFIKVLFAFSNSIKVHKIFSRSHLTLKVAPMCSKTHIIKNSVTLVAFKFNKNHIRKFYL